MLHAMDAYVTDSPYISFNTFYTYLLLYQVNWESSIDKWNQSSWIFIGVRTMNAPLSRIESSYHKENLETTDFLRLH